MYTYLHPQIIMSDKKFIQSLSINKAPVHYSVQKMISRVIKNKPVYIHQGLILYTLPHQQSLIRFHLNLSEIVKIHQNALSFEVIFYSGRRLTLPDLKASSIKRLIGVLKYVKEDLTIQR